jgi:hypothetical protein
MIALDTLYFGWPAKLDHNTQCLPLPNGVFLSAKDMTLLHRYLMGMPRKTMAAKYSVTVKAIEKRLTKIKEHLAYPYTPIAPLHEYLHHMQLIPFLLAQPNWFEIKSSHIVHL